LDSFFLINFGTFLLCMLFTMMYFNLQWQSRLLLNFFASDDTLYCYFLGFCSIICLSNSNFICF
jgi:hypothetical protein